ncbi:gamma-crystallin M2-like [Anomaloglossus baeobatrachus]|uniref:gamma-crystallin M2-like n=1 Tax=Anomaloglossus baeobatrachus TaxID=238106 RepID=UPI003F4FA399
MAKIQLFGVEGFTGDEVTVLEDTKDFKRTSIIKEVKSIKVFVGIWIMFSEANYKGDIAVYQEGEYGCGIRIKNIGSIRILPCGLENHVITAYPYTDYKGDSQVLRKDLYKKLDVLFLSHEVQKGVWLLYDDYEYKGNRIVSIIGDKVPNETETALIGPVKSLKAYTTYEKPN